MPTRTLFVSYTAEWTGPTRSLYRLLRDLPAEHRAAVLAPEEGPFLEAVRDSGGEALHVPSLALRSVPGLVRLIRRGRFDLVYANNNGGGSRNALLAARLAGVPSICHARAVGGRGSWSHDARLNLATRVVAVSEACADSLAGRVARRRIQVVHNGVDLDEFTPVSTPAPAGRRVRIASLAHLKPAKGQDDLVRALAHCVSLGLDAELRLVGRLDRDPAYVERVRALAAELGVADRVQIEGFRADTPAVLAEADVYAHGSHEEAHPRAVLEGMAMALPVVAYSVGGIPETAVHGETGLLVPFRDQAGFGAALAELVASPDLRHRLGWAGRRRVETHFSSATTARRIHEVILETLGRRGAASRSAGARVLTRTP